MIQFPLLSIEAFYWTRRKGLCRAHVDPWRPQRVFVWSSMLTADEEPGQEKGHAFLDWSQQANVQNRLCLMLPTGSMQFPWSCCLLLWLPVRRGFWKSKAIGSLKHPQGS